jgi:hypothetical protein
VAKLAPDAPLVPALEASPDSSGPAVHEAFDWSPPCKVPATYEVQREGHTYRVRLTVALDRSGDELVLSQNDAVVVGQDGEDATRPEVASALALQGALMTWYPPARIGKDGALLGIVDLDGYAQRMAKTLEASTDPQVQKLLARSAFLAAAKMVASQEIQTLWQTSVQLWLGLQMASGTEKTVTFQGQVGDESASWPVVFQHRGAVRGSPGLALLSARETFSGPAADRLFGGALKKMVGQVAPGGAQRAADAAAGMYMEHVYTVAIDPLRARPSRARYENLVRLRGQEQSGTQDVAFDWEHKVGCGD